MLLRRRHYLTVGLFAALVMPMHPSAQQTSAPGDIPIGLTWRNIGPGGTGTRIVDFAVVERTPRVVYAATASSGVWKTTNAGTTWEPQFQHEASIALGGIAVSQSNPNIVWVATGEPNMRNLRSSSWGSGIYKSTDAGMTWRPMGLANAQHMGRVVIHPTNPDVVFATVIGSMWQDNPQKNAVRGLYKTTDGGETWNKLTAGLPTTPTGRPGVDVCRSRPSTLYSVVEGADGGVYRSLDAGATWTRRNTMAASSMYYGQMRCDPNNPERVYVLQTQMAISSDGGTTFAPNIPGRSVHVDHHALWINPADSDHQWLGNDGGIYPGPRRHVAFP